jgi:hypothetical protein
LIGLPMLAVFAAFAAIVWLAYQDGAYGPPVGEPPLIAAAGTPIKLAPGDPGGRIVADQGEVRELMSDEPLPAGPERLLPLPEQPLTPTTTSDVTVAADEGDPVSPTNGAVSAERPPAAALPPAAASGSTSSGTSDIAEDEGDPVDGGPVEAEAATTPQQAEAALQALLEQVSRPSGATPQTPPSTAEREVRPAIAAPPPQPESPRQPASSAPGRTGSGIAAIEPGQPVGAATGSARQPAPAPQPTQAAAPSTDPVADRYRVQLAAVREEADARRAWDLFMIDLGPVLSRLQPYFERAETTNGVFYRVQAGPFATLDSAESVCTELKQRNASCFVVRR